MCVKGIKDLILKKKKVSKNWKGLLINKAWKMLHFKAWKVPIKYWMQISAYTKNWLVSWSDNKELLSEMDAISWNLKKKRKKYRMQNAMPPNFIKESSYIFYGFRSSKFLRVLY